MKRRKGMGEWSRVLVVVMVGVFLSAQLHAGTHHYYYTDPQGNVLAKADAQGNIIATYDYTSFGSAVTSLGPPPNGLGYAGHVNDPDTGLIYMQARYYDPARGGFLSVDPMAPTAGNTFDFNRYTYVNNNPINHTDPTGKCLEDLCIGETILVVAGVTYLTIATVRAVQNTVDYIKQESRSKPPPPLPEADGAPHSIPDGKGGYTTYPTGKETEGKQYRPTGKPHGEIPRPNVKEWEPNISPDGKEYPGKSNVRPPQPHEVPSTPPPPPPPPPPKIPGEP